MISFNWKGVMLYGNYGFTSGSMKCLCRIYQLVPRSHARCSTATQSKASIFPFVSI